MLKASRKRGLFITFEGGDGAGKTTLIDGISRHLVKKGFSWMKTREPGGTELGEEVRHLVLKLRTHSISPFAELCLFLASRAQHVSEVIEPALNEGKIVLCDRFHDSSVAYQGIARSLGAEEVFRMSSFVSHHLQPDLTFYIDVPPSIGLERVKGARSQDRLESEGVTFQEKIREAYLSIQKKEPQRMRLLNGLLSMEEVLKEALSIVDEIL